MNQVDPAAEAQQVVDLLWRREQPVRRGPRPRIGIDDVVRVGVQVADRDGLGGLSIRAVAGELGLRPMSVYTYVPSKDALLALMVDAVAADDADIVRGAPLPERLAAIADQFRDELLAHPWLLSVSRWRPVLGPHLSRRYERQLAAIDGATRTDGVPFDDVDLDTIIASLRAYATGSARAEIDARSAEATSGRSDAAWWEIYGPLLTAVMPVAEFPVSSRVGATVGELYQGPGNPASAYTYGLRCLIAGILGTSA